MECAFLPPFTLRTSLSPLTLSRCFYHYSKTNPSSLKFLRIEKRQRKLQPRMQTWSDPAVTNEYFDFLKKGIQTMATSQDCPSTIIGSGRVGSLLQELGSDKDTVLKRGEKINKDGKGPIYLCVRNADLADILKECPEGRKEDLVFMQNGMLEEFWRKWGILFGSGVPSEHASTRLNVWFGIAKKGGEVLGKNESGDESEELTCATGKWSGAVKERLEKGGLGCRVLGERDWRRNMLEKLIWISVFNLVGAVHGNITMGEVSMKHERETKELITELCAMLRGTLGVPLMSGVEQRLIDYGKSVASFPTGLKEFMWRNGWFYGKTKLAKKNGFPDPCPIHTDYLEDGKARGLIDWTYVED